jgi:hypothetical protein
MSFDAERMYELLPAIYRIRDADQGQPLKALLSVIADQVGVLEEDLAQLYDDQFIETCAPWVVPYIGDLIGYRTLHNIVPKIGSQRAEVAHTIGFRRRKGTAAMLEQLARDVTGWNARAVEFFQLLGWTQWTRNHIRPKNFYAPDLREWETLENINGAFDTVAHTVDVRHVATGQGKYNIQNIGIFLWRLNAYSLTESPAVPAASGDTQRFLFHPLGLDTQLFTNPLTEDEVTHLAEPINVPEPLRRRVLYEELEARRQALVEGKEINTYYFGTVPMFEVALEGQPNPVPFENIEICNLSQWRVPADKKKYRRRKADGTFEDVDMPIDLSVDPELGRIVFAHPLPAGQEVLVTFHYGFSDDMGGGEYDRLATLDEKLKPVEEVPAPHATIQGALNVVAGGGVVEISDSGRYEETLTISVNADQRVELRAINEHRPTLVLGGDLLINGAADAEVTLNGLLISGGAIRVNGSLRSLRLRHCTLVPATTLGLFVDLPDVTIEIDHCIVGAVRVHERSNVSITDSIVDATHEAAVAFAAANGVDAGGTLEIADSTVIGAIHTFELKLASNSIFMSEVRSEKKQWGCVRFCYLPLTSVAPRRYRCQPERESEALRVRPQFTSFRYGDPGYGQLALRTANQIRTGADDEAEMGAFHELYEPQREANLRVRLAEYLRFGLEAGPFYVT